MRRLFLFFIFVLLFITDGLTQYKLSGYVADETGESVEYATVVLLKNDSSSIISGTVTDKDGYFAFPQLTKDKYILSISYAGDLLIMERLFLDSDRELRFLLKTFVELGEFVITSDRSNLSTMGASGSSFYLSSKAKDSKDIYEALQEIPKITVDRNMRSISLSNGSNPLILINGLRREGGIGSVNPEDIESVEIIESPSIRYSKEGYAGIINLKVKKQKTKYHYFNGGVNLNPGLVFGILDATYETGKENHSFYVTGQEFHFYHNRATVTDRVTTGRTVKETVTHNKSNYYDNYLALGGDKVWNQSDYSSFSVTFRQIPVSGERNGEGTYETENTFDTFSHQRTYDDKTFTNTNNLYHKHTFENTSNIEALLRLNTSNNNNEAKQVDEGDYNYDNDIRFKNRRTSGSFSLNYNFMPFQKLNMNLGSQTYYQKNKIEQYNPDLSAFYHNEWNEHIYLDFDKVFGSKFSIAGSIGLDMFFVTVEKEKNNYYNLKPSLTIGYKPLSSHSLRLSYNKYMQMPSITQLNPYDTSTDTLVISTGNPLLEPQYIHNTQLNYTFIYRNLYLEPYVRYIQHADYIRYKGEIENNIYVRKPENTENYEMFQTGLNGRYQLKNIGYVSGRISFQRNFFDNGQIRNSLNSTFALYAYYKKLSMHLYYYDSGVEYTPTSKYAASPESQLTFTYKFDDHWDIQAGMRFLFGNKLIEQWMYDDLYEQYYRNEFSNRGHILLFGFRYNLNNKSKKRKQKKLEEGEKGFKLISE